MNLMDFFINMDVKGEEKVSSALKDVDKAASSTTASLDGTTAGAGRFAGGMDKVKAGAMLAGAGVAFLATKLVGSLGDIRSFVDETAGTLDDLGDFAEANGTTAAAVSQWGYAAQMSGSNMNAVKSSISGLNSKIGEAALGVGRGGKMFAKFGIDVKDAQGKVKDTSVILGEIAGKMQGLSNQEAIAMASKLGINTSLIPLLLKGKEGIAALTAEAAKNGAVTNEQAAAAGAYADMMSKANARIQGVKNSVATALMPAMTELGTKLADVTEKTAGWLQENDLLLPVIKVLGGTAIVAMVAALGLLLAPLWGVVAATIAWTAALLLNPITWIALAVVALIAGIVALIHWIIQNKQIFINAYETMRAKIVSVIDAMKAKWEELRSWVVSKIEALKAAFSNFIGVLSGIDWAAPFRPLMMTIDTIISSLNKITGWKMPSFGTGGFFGGSSPAGSASPVASTSPTPWRGGGGGVVNNNQRYNVAVNAPNNSNPRQVASMVDRQFRGAAMSGTA
jgi:hypothetical protein